MGVAFLVAEGQEAEVHAYLTARELISDAYLEKVLPVVLNDGRAVEAVCYVIDHAHPQYVAGLSLREQADIIATSAGLTGTNADYLWNTTRHLADEGLVDSELEWLAAEVRVLKGMVAK